MAIVVTYPGIAPPGEEVARIVLSSLVIGDVVSLNFAGGGATLNHSVLSAVVATEHSNLVSAINAFKAAQGADGFWSTISSVTTDGAKVDVVYADSIGNMLGAYASAPTVTLDPLFTVTEINP